MELPLTDFLSFDPALFDVVDQASAISKGSLRHEFLFRCRKPVPHTQLKLSMRNDGQGLYFPEIILPITIAKTLQTQINAFGPPALFLAGIWFAMVGVLSSQGHSLIDNPFLNLLFLLFPEELKGFMKFLGIAFSSLAGFWAYVVRERS